MWKFLPSTDAIPDVGALSETTRCAIVPPKTDPETVVNFLFVASGGKAIVCKTVESLGTFKKVDDLCLRIVTLAGCPPGSWIFAETKPDVWTEAIVAGLVPMV